MRKVIGIMMMLLLTGCVSNITSIKQINPEVQGPMDWRLTLFDYGDRHILINRSGKTIDEVVDIICIHSSSMAQGGLYTFGKVGSATSHKENLESIAVAGMARTSDKSGATICNMLIVYDYQVRKTAGVEKWRLFMKYIPDEKLSFRRVGYVTKEDWDNLDAEAYKIKVSEDEKERKMK